MIALGTLLVLCAALDPTGARVPPPLEENPRVERGVSTGLAVRRFALIAAANDGGQARVRLRYAVRDAEAFARVLRDLGGVAREDELLLVQPSVAELQGALEKMRARLERARSSAARLELILYYSGHSDPAGLLLGEEQLEYEALKAELASLPADVRIAILDSCASGAMTRKKGGRRRAPFEIDASSRVTGYAVLTSSSEDEAAQESDRIGASFFTHFLVSALRGAADLSQDGRVTLNEAYHFAFHETLAGTENTLGGPQHPAYEIQLVGTGDVVMTDLRGTSAALTLDEPLSGRVAVRDENGHLAAELRKVPGRRVELGLDPGRYSVQLEREGQRFQGKVRLVEGSRTPLDLAQLTQVESERTVLRGGEKRPRRVVPVDLGIAPPVSINTALEGTLNHLSINLGLGQGFDLHGLGMALGGVFFDGELEGAQASVGFNHVGAASRGAQATVGFNLARASFAGAQASVGFNYVGGHFEGVQTTVGLNFAEETARGFTGSVGANWAGRAFEGVQGSVGLNHAGGRVQGFQIATGVNYAKGPVQGGQLGVGVNLSERLEGVQLSALVNVTGSMEGVQAGLVNLATEDESEGVQLGLFNFAPAVAGLQLGLVNIVERSRGVSLGLVSYSAEDGILDLKLSTSDVGLAGLTLEVGAGAVYTLFSALAGTAPEPDALAFGLGLGVRAVLSPEWEISVEAATHAIADDANFRHPDLISTARLTPGIRLDDAILVFAGPTVNVLVDLEGLGPDRNALAPRYAARPSDDRVYVWPGLVAGLQLF